jgi:hypothetical protein
MSMQSFYPAIRLRRVTRAVVCSLTLTGVGAATALDSGQSPPLGKLFEPHPVMPDQASTTTHLLTLAGIIRSKPEENSDAEAEIQYWSSVDQTNAQDLAAYLVDYPEGLFSRLAQNKLERLGGVPESAAPAMLTVRSNVKEDNLFIDDIMQGQTSSTAIRLPSGAYNIRVEKKGYQVFELDLALAAGEARTVHAQLVPEAQQPLPASGEVHSEQTLTPPAAPSLEDCDCEQVVMLLALAKGYDEAQLQDPNVVAELTLEAATLKQAWNRQIYLTYHEGRFVFIDIAELNTSQSDYRQLAGVSPGSIRRILLDATEQGQIDVFTTAGLSREAWNLVQLLGK